MAGEAYPNGAHDFITDELQSVHGRETQTVLESYYAEYCTAFRARVFEKMFREKAIQDGIGWAVFDLQQEEESGSIALSEGSTDVLVRVHPRPRSKEIDGKPLPDIHIITNESVIGLNGMKSWLAYDFTLDAEDDSQYLLDCFVPESEEGRLLTKHGAFFWVNPGNNELCVINRPRHYFTSQLEVTADGHKVHPFGRLPHLEDKIHSIETAVEILDKIQNIPASYIAANTA